MAQVATTAELETWAHFEHCCGVSLFDRFVFVDWSASSRPRMGPDSVWIAEGHLQSQTATNPPTRSLATAHVRELLIAAVAAEERVLVGFDFPYGYATGFAHALGLHTAAAPWRQTWDELCRHVVDRVDNRNNRFQVAAQFNERLGDEAGPFWGCPVSQAGRALSSHRGQFPYRAGGGVTLAEYRLTERRFAGSGRQLSSVWKLYTQPTVGSQALLGIPRLHQLRDEPALADSTLVWPFETGFSGAPGSDSRPYVLYCEVWPGVIDVDLTLHSVRDAAQMISLVRWAAGLDRVSQLGPLLAPTGLSTAAAATCVSEEGWILGA